MNYFEVEDLSRAPEDQNEITVGRFSDYSIRVARHDDFLKVMIVSSTSNLKRITWIPLNDDDEYDNAIDLKIC